MRTTALLDPWLVDFSPGYVPPERLRALDRFEGLIGDWGLKPARILDGSRVDSWLRDLPAGSPARRVIAKWRRQLERWDDAGSADARLLSDGCPEVDDYWRAGLSDAARPDDPSRWRDPYFLVPSYRVDSWPAATTVSFEVRSRSAAGVLATLEEFAEHPFAALLLDPWLYQDARATPKGRNPNPNKRHRLPRHPKLQGVPVRRLREALAKIHDPSGGKADRYYYLPPYDWDPEGILEREKWEQGKVFPTGTSVTVKGIKRGPVDRAGRIWDFDHIQEWHWDVEEPSGTNERPAKQFADVSHTGEILRLK